jgi:hypothetical protein
MTCRRRRAIAGDDDERRLGLRALPFTLLTFDFSRIPSIMEERATTYQALFFRSLQLEGVFPDSKTVTGIILRHTPRGQPT